MGLCVSTTSRLRSTKKIGKSTTSDSDSDSAIQQRPLIISIHILDDDSLLNIFHLYRPFFLGEDDDDPADRLTGGKEPWNQGRWWYQLAHVCQRWRFLIFRSASYLRLSLVFTNRTPVENMLAHSPPLPLTIDYDGEDGITAEDEEGLLLALKQRHRLRHLRLFFPVQDLQKLVMAIDGEFPILEYLIVESSEKYTALMLPETLQAPNLQHLMLGGFACPIRPRLHPTAAGLATLHLAIFHQSAYFAPNLLLQWISFMPQLESLDIAFKFPVPNRNVERQLTHTPITTHITLPNFRLFTFAGVGAYLEAILCQIMAPRLETLQFRLFKQLTFSFSCLSQFINTTENLRFHSAAISFMNTYIFVEMNSPGADSYAFRSKIDIWHLDWQVSSMVQISNALNQQFSAVEELTLYNEEHSESSEEHNDVDRIQWHNILRAFTNVKTLRVEDGIVEELSRCLRLEDEELPLELLPELQRLIYSGSRDARNAFASFVDTRQIAGRPVALLPLNPSPSLSLRRLSTIESLSTIVSLSDEDGNDKET